MFDFFFICNIIYSNKRILKNNRKVKNEKIRYFTIYINYNKCINVY